MCVWGGVTFVYLWPRFVSCVWGEDLFRFEQVSLTALLLIDSPTPRLRVNPVIGVSLVHTATQPVGMGDTQITDRRDSLHQADEQSRI